MLLLDLQAALEKFLLLLVIPERFESIAVVATG